jgi:holo-[acyl-carrier protein] synthase
MSVINLPAGRPAITLSSNASARWRDLLPEAHEARIDLTYTDDFPFAGANVIISGRPEMAERR